MTKPEELRIGNWVKFNGIEYQVSATCDDSCEYVHLANFNGDLSSADLEPIPITEDWLKRLGFEKTMEWTYRIHLTGNKYMVYYLGLKGWSIGNKSWSDFSCEHVHRLQNVYYELSGKELTLKP